MNEANDIEQRIRELRPAPAPADLMARLSAANPDAPAKPRPKVVPAFIAWVGGIAAAAACVALIHMRGGGSDTPPDPVADAPLHIIQKDSTLLGTRTLAITEHGGQLWEISEQEWRDDTIALCSTSPVELHSAVTRREIVCAPVEFQ